MEIATHITGWLDSHVSWGFLGFCLIVYCLAHGNNGTTINHKCCCKEDDK